MKQVPVIDATPLGLLKARVRRTALQNGHDLAGFTDIGQPPYYAWCRCCGAVAKIGAATETYTRFDMGRIKAPCPDANRSISWD